MIDCDRCAKSIGSEAEPICVAPNESLLCAECFELEVPQFGRTECVHSDRLHTE